MTWTAVVLLASTAVAAAPDDAPRQPAPAEATPTLEPAEAPVPPAPAWPKEFPRAAVWEVAVVGGLGVANVIIAFAPPPQEASWTGGIAFDDWVRGGLRLNSANARIAVASFSDWLIAAMAALPLVDAWIDAGYSRGRPDVAWRLTLIDLEAMLSTSFLTLGVQRLTARQRPYAAACLTQPSSVDCSTSTADNTSFPSGHSSVAFTAAVLECVNHGHLDVERTGWSAIACPLSLSVATVTGLLRIASDKHYASDVLVGALVGSAIGYAIPTLHFALASSDTTTTVTPAVTPTYVGLALTGRF